MASFSALAWRTRVATLTLLSLLGAACGGGGHDADTGPADGGMDTGMRDTGAGDTAPADTGVVDSGPPDITGMDAPTTHSYAGGVLREDILLDGPAGPENPTTMEATPTELNRFRLLRYRQEATPAADPRAILITVPGMLGGGPAFEALALALVRRSVAAGAPVEIWSLERRANLLEDLRGMDTAEAAGDPENAFNYYFNGSTIDGTPFGGFVTGADVSYASEWGLALQIAVVHQVIGLVPAAERKGRVFLMGHAQGAEICERYGAWRFEDGSRGADEIAGMVLIDADGLVSDTPLTETQYMDDPGEPPVGGLASIAGLNAIRSEGSKRFVQIPIFGTDLLALSELMAMRANLAPDAVVRDVVRDQSLSLLLSLDLADVPPMSNAAAYGFAFDQDFATFDITALHLGGTDGPVESYTSLFGTTLIHPSDPTHIYTWTAYDATTPPELVDLANNTLAVYAGPTNLIEWYSPTRLILDLMATRGAAVPETGYQADNGLRAFDGALDDAPVLAIATKDTTASDYDALRSRMAATLGADRVHAGADRATSTDAFKVVEYPDMTHGDPINAEDDATLNPVPMEVYGFVDNQAAAGTFAAPTFP